LVILDTTGKLLPEFQVQEMLTPDEQHRTLQAFQIGRNIIVL
jgi:hypothetical protein